MCWEIKKYIIIQTNLGDDLLEFHQAVVSTLRDADDVTMPLDPAPMAPILPQLQPNNPLLTHTSEDMARLSETHNELGTDQLEEEADTGKTIQVDVKSTSPQHVNQLNVCACFFAVFKIHLYNKINIYSSSNVMHAFTSLIYDYRFHPISMRNQPQLIIDNNNINIIP